MSLTYLSLFSGIEAASVAWKPLGWECVAVAEIEPFPCSVLKHHHPDVPNLGNVMRVAYCIRRGVDEVAEFDLVYPRSKRAVEYARIAQQMQKLGRIDLIVFGSPCQDLSVAGKRAGLAGARSGLFHTAITIVEWARERCGTRFALWENVPGAFSSNRGADFAVVVGELAGMYPPVVPPKGWGNEGALVGEKGMVEWSTLDAQWFGVAQRRRRVFAFADFGDWRGRCPVLLESESLRGDSAPSRQAGEGVAGTLGARTKGGGGLGTDFDLGGGGLLGLGVAPTLRAGGNRTGGDRPPGTDVDTAESLVVTCTPPSFLPEVAWCLQERDAKGSDSDTKPGHLIPVIGGGFDAEPIAHVDTMPTLRAAAAADGPGHSARSGDSKDEYIVAVAPREIAASIGERMRGQDDSCADNLVMSIAIPIISDADREDSSARTPSPDAEGRVRLRDPGLGIGEAGDPMFTLQATKPHAVAFQSSQSGVRTDDVHATLDSNNGSRRHNGAVVGMRVRRLTPRECERLQAFPDDHTLVVHNRKPAKDGPRYKALGNSMCTNVMRYIGEKIDLIGLFQ